MKTLLVLLALSIVPAQAFADYAECQGEAESAALAQYREDSGYTTTPAYDFWTDDVTDKSEAGSGILSYWVNVVHYHSGDAGTYQVDIDPNGCYVLSTAQITVD
jgi:hypothetical protein